MTIFDYSLPALKIFAAVGRGFGGRDLSCRKGRKIMNENIATIVLEESNSAASARAWKTVVSGGLTVGLMDCLAATINAGLRGATFTQVWQYVASGLLGKNSYDYGWWSVALG